VGEIPLVGIRRFAVATAFGGGRVCARTRECVAAVTRLQRRRERSGRRRRARAAARGPTTCAGVGRARRDRARKTAELRMRVSSSSLSPPLPRACAAFRENRPGAGEEHERRRGGPLVRTRVGRARRGRAPRTGEVRARVSLRRRCLRRRRVCARMRERAAPPLLRSCSASARSVRAPAKSTSGAARGQLGHGSRAGAARRARKTGEMRPPFRFAVDVAFRVGGVQAEERTCRAAAATPLPSVGEKRPGAGE
jgi:hypothetical protein